MDPGLTIVGGGLAGSKAAFQAARRGINVRLFEMRPARSTGAHVTPYLAELVCSNSLGSKLKDRATGLLRAELEILGSLLVEVAGDTQVPAGGAMAVDRQRFAEEVTRRLQEHPRVEIIREEVTAIPDSPCILASGPLTSPPFAHALASFTGEDNLYFYDALAPIVTAESINMNIAYRASRYDRGEQPEGDYINCPLNAVQYQAFVEALLTAERVRLHDFESEISAGVTRAGKNYFEGCLPIEVIAERGERSLAYGPMRPVGLDDPRTGRWPHAVLQLRQDNAAGTLYNLVGFQTNLTYKEQDRVLRMIPGLEQAEFVRYGQMHRNTFINSPDVLKPTLESKVKANLWIAGQLCGVEGYMGNIATGLVAGSNAAHALAGKAPLVLPQETMLASLLYYITSADPANFQPMKANFGLMLPLEDGVKRNKRQRAQAYAARSLTTLEKTNFD